MVNTKRENNLTMLLANTSTVGGEMRKVVAMMNLKNLLMLTLNLNEKPGDERNGIGVSVVILAKKRLIFSSFFEKQVH